MARLRPPCSTTFIALTTIFIVTIISVRSEEANVRLSLVQFLDKLSSVKVDLGWNVSTDPCLGGWTGVSCNNRSNSVRSIVLEDLALDGTIDARLLCKARRLNVLSLAKNSIQGPIPSDIANCTQLSHIYLGQNRLSGSLPVSLSSLNNLKRLDVSNNNLSGGLPDLPRISGLLSFIAKNNRLTGSIPQFNFANFQRFDVSDNLFSGQVPPGGDRIGSAGFAGNPGLCGKPLLTVCPPPASSITPPAPREGEDEEIIW